MPSACVSRSVAALYSAGVIMVALWAGASLIGFFGVTTAALRIGGGLVVASRGWELLSAPRPTARTPASRHRLRRRAGADDAAFFPLTMPFTAGPGAIAVAIALSANRPTAYKNSCRSSPAAPWPQPTVAVMVGFCYASADRVEPLLGPAGARVVTCLTAFLLLCIGVQIVLTGVQDALPPLLAGHG